MSVSNDQDNEFDNQKLTDLDSLTVIRNPSFDKQLSIKKYVDDSIGEGTIVSLSQALENCLKVSVGKEGYILTKYNNIQVTDTTFIKNPNSGKSLLQQLNTKCNDKNGNGKLQNFLESTKTKVQLVIQEH